MGHIYSLQVLCPGSRLPVKSNSKRESSGWSVESQPRWTVSTQLDGRIHTNVRSKSTYSKALKHPLSCPVSALSSIPRLSTRPRANWTEWPPPPGTWQDSEVVKNLSACEANGLQETKGKSGVDPDPRWNKKSRLPNWGLSD